MRVADFFSGIGGFSLGLERAGMETTTFCESDPKCRAVLARHWPDVNCHQDIRTLNATALDADLFCGGFPCQFTSTAARGRNNAIDLWPEFRRCIAQAHPTWVIAENVPGIGDGGLERISRELELEGYWVWPVRIDTSPAFRSRGRHRIFWLAYADGQGQSRCAIDEKVARVPTISDVYHTDFSAPVGMDDGVPGRMDRLHQLGNAVTPYAAEIIGRAIMRTQSTSGEANVSKD